MTGKYALVIGNSEYQDARLAQLSAPGRDADDLARILRDRDYCAFDDVRVLLNEPEPVVREAVDEFFDERTPDDLLLLYFSGHGVRDEQGMLYLAVKNTNRSRLRSTAIKSDFIHEAMEQSRARRQVLILDCCNSGAVQQGTKAAAGGSIGVASAFGGTGRIILTASDSLQYAWQGDAVMGNMQNSLFTHFLVQGLKGEAENDGDGVITVDELYDYAYEQVRRATPNQTPSKFASKQEGEIVLRTITRLDQIKAAPLPDALADSLDNSIASVRLGAVEELARLLIGRNLALSRRAREELEKLSTEDDSFRVRKAAADALEPVRQAEEQAKKKEEERLAAERAEADRLAAQRAEEQHILEAHARNERLINEGLERKRLAELRAQQEQAARENAQAGRTAGTKASRPVGKPVTGPLPLFGSTHLPRKTLLYGGGAALFSVVIIVLVVASWLSRLPIEESAAATGTAWRSTVATGAAHINGTETAVSMTTAQGELNYLQDAIARSQRPYYGPVNNTLNGTQYASFLKTQSFGVSLKNFIVRAVFVNPYPTSTGTWACGFVFRQEGADQEYQVIAYSDSTWQLLNWHGSGATKTVVTGGTLANLDASDNGSNKISLIAEDSNGKLYVNDVFVSNLNLTAHMSAGDVGVVTGFDNGGLTDANSMGYSYFTIWSLP